MNGSSSYNNVYVKSGSGKWATANIVPSEAMLAPTINTGVGQATRAAAQKSHANRQAKATKVGAGTTSGTGGVGVSTAAAGGGGSAPPSHLRSDRAGLKGKRGWTKKKGGGHGKYHWGVPGDEFMGEPELSRYDPNYDSDNEEDVIFSVLEHHERMAKGTTTHLFGSPSGVGQGDANGSGSRFPPKIPLREFKASCVEMVDEYLTSEDVDELKDSLAEIHSPMLHYEFVRRAITLAMERNSRERELISVLLSELHGSKVLSSEQVAKGFERIFEMADDIVLDIPKAKKYLSQFLARAVADEILPPSFLNDSLIVHIGGQIVEQAKVLLSIKHGLVRLEHVWGPTSHSSIEELKDEIKMLLQEFLESSDLDEACECVKRLGVPHFHHEVVKRAVVLSLDYHEREQAMMASLLAELCGREIVSEKQMEIGFGRLYQALPDMELDTPGARQILDVFLRQAVNDRCVSEKTATLIKERYSKR